jgi:alkyl hydroperoxide reductase subunit F
MLDANLTQQLKTYLANIREPIELVASLDDAPKSRELGELLGEIAALSDKIAVVHANDDKRTPSFMIRRTGTDIGVRFAGIPMGHEFTSLVLALLQVGGHPSKAAQELIEQVKNIDGDYAFETYFSLTCQNCPDVVQALNLMAVLNPRITHVAIDGGLFPAEVDERKVMAVPTVYLNGEPFASGRMELEQIVAKIDSGATARAAEKIKDQGAIRRARRRRRAGRRRGGHLCRAQGHPHRHRHRTLRRAGARHDVDREFHLGLAHRRPQAGCPSGAAREGL